MRKQRAPLPLNSWFCFNALTVQMVVSTADDCAHVPQPAAAVQSCMLEQDLARDVLEAPMILPSIRKYQQYVVQTYHTHRTLQTDRIQ